MVAFCEGWMPLANCHDIAGHVAWVTEEVAEAGRDPDSVLIIANGAKTDQLEVLEFAGVDEVRPVFMRQIVRDVLLSVWRAEARASHKSPIVDGLPRRC